MSNLDDIFNVPELNELKKELAADEENSLPAVIDNDDNSLTVKPEIPSKITSDHDQAMDEIAQCALDGYKEIMDIAQDAQHKDVGHIYTAAVAMLKNAISAKNSKTQAKLKAVELALKKQLLDQGDASAEKSNKSAFLGSGEVIVADRNSVIDSIKKERDAG